MCKSAEERFFSYVQVDPVTGCWEWTGHVTRKGYGQFYAEGTHIQAHRWSYLRWVGDVPSGLVLDHFRCDNPKCANPKHVRPVTQRENILRGSSAAVRNLAKVRCPKGHELTEDNCVSALLRRGHRSCLKCHRRRANEQVDVLRAARLSLGVSYKEYIAQYGQSVAVARRILGDDSHSFDLLGK